MADHYQILEIDPKARQGVVKAAYKALARQFAENEAYLKQLNGAKDVLLDEDKRREYDRERVRNAKKGVAAKKKTIGDYRIIEQIAEGGFGVTYKAEHKTLGTPVCIKHASNISALDEEMLFDEARAMWDLRHFGIPAIRDILQMDDGSYSLVMSYVPGPTLAEIIEKKGSLDPEHVAWIGERIINILKYLHFHGVVHGDMKPQNIIVQPDTHTVSLVDYGLSAVKPNSKSDGKGYTPKFAAPEQIAGKAPLPETDFYGLGLTLIYALGGDVDSLKVPDYTPDGMCKILKSFIVRDVLSRPHWQKEDIHELWAKAREEDFGRRYSNLKPLEV